MTWVLYRCSKCKRTTIQRKGTTVYCDQRYLHGYRHLMRLMDPVKVVPDP